MFFSDPYRNFETSYYSITLRQQNMNIRGWEYFTIQERDGSFFKIWYLTLNLTWLFMTFSILYLPQNTTTAQKQQGLDIAQLWSTEIVRNRTEQMDESLHLEEKVHSDQLPGLSVTAWAGCSGAVGVAGHGGLL